MRYDETTLPQMDCELIEEDVLNACVWFQAIQKLITGKAK